MRPRPPDHAAPQSRLASIVLLLIIAFGLNVRWHAVNHKTFFQDEAYSALRITGHTEADYLKLRDGNVRSVSELTSFQKMDGGSSLAATLKSIATEEPQRGPLFYGLSELWVKVVGTSIFGFRSIAVIVGLLVVGAAFLFGKVLFESLLGGLVLAALVAVSPFHILYAQQAREYGMLTLTILLSSAALLRVERLQNSRRWIVYGIAMIAGLLSSPFFVLVIPSYLAFVVVRNRRTPRSRDVLVGFAISTGAAIATVSPWYAYAMESASRVATQTSWGANAYPLKFYLEKVIFNLGAVFFDFEFADVRYTIALVAILGAITYLAVSGFRKFPKSAGFATGLALPSIVVFFLNDIHARAHFATIPRYLVPVWIAVEIIVASGILRAMQSVGKSKIAGLAAFALVISCGVFCAIGDARYATWWANNDNEPTELVARAINGEPKPIVLASNFAIALSLAHYVNPSVRFELYVEDGPPRLYPSGNPNMLFIPIQRERAEILSRYPVLTLEPAIRADQTVVSQFHKNLAVARANSSSPGSTETPVESALWIVEKKLVAPATVVGAPSE